MNRPRILVLAAALALSSATVCSAGLETRGKPSSALTPLGTYGMGVATRVGIRTLVPNGWKIFVHQSAVLPDSLDWSVEDTWVQPLERLTRRGDLSVLIDWESRAVLVRTTAVAVQEAATRQEIGQAARTPLPKFSNASKTPAPDVTAAAQAPAWQMETTTLGFNEPEAPLQVSAIRTNPTTSMVRSQASAVTKRPSRLTSNANFSYTAAVALNKPSAKKVVQAIADKYNLRVVWAATSDFTLKGPVTLLADSATQDVDLLQKAIGTRGPYRLELATGEGVLRVFDASVPPAPGSTLGAIVVPQRSDELALTHNVTRTVAVAEEGSLVSAVADKVLGDVPPMPMLQLNIAAGQPLEDALTKFAHGQGYTFDWRIEGGFEANRAMTYQASSVPKLLAQLLPSLGASADVYTRDRHIVVRPGDSRN